MTYHSLAIYYDNQLAENEQKRVPRDNRFANLHKLHRAKNGEQQWYYPCVILGGGLRAHRPISLSVSPSGTSRMLSRTMPPSGSLVSPSGTSRMLSRTMPPSGPTTRPSGSSVSRLFGHTTPAGTHACGQAIGHACGQAFGQRHVHRKCSSSLCTETALCIKAECMCLLCSSSGHPHNDFDRTGIIDRRFRAVH